MKPNIRPIPAIFVLAVISVIFYSVILTARGARLFYFQLVCKEEPKEEPADSKELIHTQKVEIDEPNETIAIAHTGWFHQFNEPTETESNEPQTETETIEDLNFSTSIFDPNGFFAIAPVISICFGECGNKQIDIDFSSDKLRITGDTEDMNDAADVFFNHFLKSMVDNYIKSRIGE